MNMVKLKKKEVIFIIGLLIAITLNFIAFLFDKEIIKFIASLRNSFFDYIFISVAFVTNIIVIFIFITVLFLWRGKKKRWIPVLWLSLGLTTLVSYIFKIIIQRPRPFQTGVVSVFIVVFDFIKNSANTWNYSFPSFQAMAVFAVLPLFNKEFKRFRWFWLAFAGLVALSRVYFGAHYMSDIISGGIIGYLIGIFLVWFEERYCFGERIIKKVRI